MTYNAEDNDIQLPKTKANKADRYSLVNLNAEQIVKLVADFKPGFALSGNVFASAFGPLADDFIKRVESNSKDLTTHLQVVAEVWDEFCREQIELQYEKLIEQNASDEVLHYSLFAKRRILELVRIKDEKLFNQIICIRPFHFYSVSNLWDPNSEKTNFVRNYFGIIAKAYLDFYSNQVCADSYIKFINAVKSPYRHVYEISNEFESDYGSSGLRGSNGFRAIYLKELLSARTGVVLKIRAEQLEGFEQGDFYMPPPITLGAISSLTLQWLAEQSFSFKNDLPANLLEFILEAQPFVYKILVADLGKILISDFLKGVEVDLDPEFPEFNQSFLCYKEISKLHQKKVQHHLFESTLHQELLFTTCELVEKDKSDKDLDYARLKKSIAVLQGRRIYRPWEIISLNKEIRGLQRALYQLELEQKVLERKSEIIKEITKEVYQKCPQPELPLIMSLADRVCVNWRAQNQAFDKELGDPLMYADVFIFSDKNSKINVISADLQELGYVETKLKYLADKELVDYMHIWRELHGGRNIKSLRQEFNDLRVNRVLVEYERKVNKKSFAEIKDKHPRYSKIIDLVSGREALEESFEKYAKTIILCTRELFDQYLKNDSKIVNDALDRFQVYAECAAIIWDWLSAEISNPYQEATEKYQKFLPWFEKEICRHLKNQDQNTYLALNYKRPSSVLGLEPGADFNWRDDDVFKSYITTLTNHYLDLTSNFTKEEVLKTFTRYKDNLVSLFVGYLNPRRYQLDYASDKILLLDFSQKNLFSSQYRREALEAWVGFHESAFFGNQPFNGLFFELVMKELKKEYPQQHLIICLALLDLEREQIKDEILRASSSIENEQDEQFLEYLYLNQSKVDFLEGLKQSLS